MVKKNAQFDLDQFLPYVMVNFAGRLSQNLASYYQTIYGMTLAEWRVMANVNQHETLMSKHIAERTSMDKVKVSRAVQSLCGKGWIKKVEHKEDSRAFNILMTAAGKKQMSAMLPGIRTWEKNLLDAISDRELNTMIKTVQKLDRQLDKPD